MNELTEADRKAIADEYVKRYPENLSSISYDGYGFLQGSEWGIKHARAEADLKAVFQAAAEAARQVQETRQAQRIKELEAEVAEQKEARDHYAGLAKKNNEVTLKINWENGELKAEVARLKEQLEFERLNVRTALNLSPSSAKDTPDTRAFDEFNSQGKVWIDYKAVVKGFQDEGYSRVHAEAMAREHFSIYRKTMAKEIEAKLKSSPVSVDIKRHTPLPEGKYYFGEEEPNGVRPVFGAHDQLLWYSVPGLTTRFTSEKEAHAVAALSKASPPKQ